MKNKEKEVGKYPFKNAVCGWSIIKNVFKLHLQKDIFSNW